MKRPLCCSEEMFQATVDGQDEEDELGSNCGAKKRRLSSDQVGALEKIFEVDDKLEPERKLRLARELQLEPRQIAVWFQNRRARWKTKQLERDYVLLKEKYDALRQEFDTMKNDNQSLLLEIKQLKSKIDEDVEGLNSSSAKEENSTDSDSSDVLNYNMTSLGANYDINTMGFYDEFFVSSSELNSTEIGGFSVDHYHHNYHDEIPLTVMKVEESDELLSSEEEPCNNFFSDKQAPELNYWD